MKYRVIQWCTGNVGAPIARLECRIVCEELLDATQAISRTLGLQPVSANSIMVRRLEHLPLDANPALDERR